MPLAEARELKEHFASAEKTGTFALQLDAQNRAKEYLLAGQITYQGRVYRLEQPAMNVARAMFMLYGNYNPASRRARWRGAAGWAEEGDAEDRPFEAIPVFSKSFREGNADKFILVTGSVAEGAEDFGDCHACGTKIGVAVFHQQGGVWKLEVGQKDVGTYGAFGTPPTPALVKIGADRYALTLSWGDIHQGVTDEGVDFIDRAGGCFKEILSLHTAEDTSGFGTFRAAEDNVSFDSKLEYVPGADPVYFDIKVTTRGRKGVRVGRRVVMRPFVEVKVYKFSGGVYKLAGPG